MKQATTGMMLAGAAGAAAVMVAYATMKPSAKRELKRDMRNVSNEVAQMAQNIKDQI